MHATADLEDAVELVEQRLGALADSLRQRNPLATEADANGLQQALASAVERFAQATRDGTLSDSTRLRLARVGAQVAHQRETLARATAALDRAVEVLMPATAPRTLYSAQGLPELPSRIGSITA